MIIKYISSAMEKNDFEKLFLNSQQIPGQQAQKFNRLMIEGFAENDQTVFAISGRPVTSLTCKSKWLSSAKTKQNERVIYIYNSVVNIPIIKNILQTAGTFFRVLMEGGNNEQVVVMDVLNASVAYGAMLAAKIKRIPCIGIVTDLPQLLVTGTGGKHVKMVDKVIEGCSGYVFLTEAMDEVLNPRKKPYVVVEGLCDTVIEEKCESPNKEIRIVLYAGLLDSRYGVKNMVDSFLAANIPGAELHVYGDGSYVEELKNLSKQHRNVVYHGVVMNDEIVEAERKADLLVNPRPTHEEFTKYSFPSKNMEYMASGTPVLTTNLPGMPREYQDYVFLFHGDDVETMTSDFISVLNKPKEELKKVGKDARNFVLHKKNKKVQTGRILELLEIK